MHNWSEGDPKGPILQEVFDEFMAANPDVKLEVEVFSDLDIPVKVETAFTAGQEPDIVFNNYAGSKQTWLDQGVAIDVTDLMKEWGFEGKFVPVALKSATDKQGRIVGFPIEGFTWPVWYNTKILDEAGVEIPKTVDELLAAVPKIRDAGYEPFVTGGSDWSGYAAFTTITQLPMTDEEMRQVYGNGGFATDPKGQEGVELFTQLRDAGVFAENTEGLTADAMAEMFFTEKAAMMQAGSWSFGSLPPEMADHVALGGFPVLDDNSPHEKPVIYAGFGKAVWITRNGATKIDAVRRFIQFLFSDESLLKFIERVGMPTPLLTVQADPSKLSAFIVQSVEYVKDVDVVDITDNYVPQDRFDDLYRATSSAFIPGTTPDEIEETLDAIYE
jgi:multiple sugar transport system substrate-binding protein